jgi:hypothetical protein
LGVIIVVIGEVVGHRCVMNVFFQLTVVLLKGFVGIVNVITDVNTERAIPIPTYDGQKTS